jgi:energy-converting hydrogenase Eha subunit A
VMNLNVLPKIDFHDNADMYPASQRDRPQAGALYGSAAFETFARGSGTAGVEPPVDALLKACGASAVVGGGTSVTYSFPYTLAFTAVDIDVYKGNAYLVSCNNTVMDCTWTFEPNKPVRESWTGSGTFAAPTSASGTASAATGSLQPMCTALDATCGGISNVLKNVEISLGNVFPTADQDIAGTNGIQNPQLSNREVTFKVTTRLPLPSTLNWYTYATAGTKTTLSIVAGTVGGNIITYKLDGYFMAEPDHGESEGFHENTLSFRMSDVSGENQYTITYT